MNKYPNKKMENVDNRGEKNLKKFWTETGTVRNRYKTKTLDRKPERNKIVSFQFWNGTVHIEFSLVHLPLVRNKIILYRQDCLSFSVNLLQIFNHEKNNLPKNSSTGISKTTNVEKGK